MYILDRGWLPEKWAHLVGGGASYDVISLQGRSYWAGAEQNVFCIKLKIVTPHIMCWA